VLGLAGSFGLTRLLSNQLYSVTPTDPATFIGVSVLLGAIALAATLIPALRATRVDPVVALREE
jgi:putative ABC transport system permease protein